MKAFNKDNVAKEKNTPGAYVFYDSIEGRLYIGRSNIIRHRLQSYLEKDDFIAHPTKRVLRKNIQYYTVQYGRQHYREEDEKIKRAKPPHNHTLKD